MPKPSKEPGPVQRIGSGTEKGGVKQKQVPTEVTVQEEKKIQKGTMTHHAQSGDLLISAEAIRSKDGKIQKISINRHTKSPLGICIGFRVT